MLRIVLALILPFGVAVGPLCLEGLNDEPSHVNYVTFLADSCQFPVQSRAVDDSLAFLHNDYEYYQPPLYYGLSAALLRLSNNAHPLVVGRLVSLLCGLMTLWVLWRIAASAGCSRGTQRCMCVCGALFPTHVYFSALVSNDSMSWLVSALVVWRLLKVISIGRERQKRIWRDATVLGMLLGGGMLVKSSVLILYPVATAAYVLAWYRQRDRRLGVALVLAVVVSLLMAAPWYLRNLAVYDSILAFEVACGAPRAPLDSLSVLIGFVKYSIQTFWFPMQHIPGSRAAGMLGWCGALIIVGVAVACIAAMRRGAIDRFVAALLGILLCFTLLAYLRFNLVWPHAEGRFLLPAFPAIMLAFAVALQQMHRIYNRRWVVTAGILLLCCWPWLYLLVSSPIPLTQ